MILKPIISSKCLLLIILIASGLLSHSAHAEWGDTIHVVTHDNTKVITNPSTGSNAYPHWGSFPTADVQYRKVVLSITYRCPDSLHCGEWDYIDAIYLLNGGKDTSSKSRIELARMISPYGWRFDSEWEFGWQVDITDFAPLLHDSVQIEFVHTGYESNVDRGWLVTLDFALIKGRPPMQFVGMETLWCGSFPYGDTVRPIEQFLHPIQFQNDAAAIARLRIHQTGHGMDDSANCAEFCRKFRRVYFDDSLINERYIWRECSDNPLFPQAGTWLFDRANWCPGEVVYPDVYDFVLSVGDTLSVNIDMEPYVNPNRPSANYHIYSYLFYYDIPWAGNDVSIEEIIIPSNLPMYSRMNPSCSGAQFVVKNNGRNPVTSMTVYWGYEDSRNLALDWHGEILPQQTTVIEIPEGPFLPTNSPRFYVSVDNPNGKPDEYPLDNSATTQSAIVPVLPPRFVLQIRTNNQPEQNTYALTDNQGKPVLDHASGTLSSNTTYQDTLSLIPGCYTFTMTDTADDGLDFWFNPEGGYGFIRFLTFDGRMIKNLNADFGREARYSFSVSYESLAILPNPLPVVQIFPPRNNGAFEVNLFFDTASATTVKITNDSTKATVFEKDYGIVKESVLPIDITSQAEGVYYVHVISRSTTVSRRIRIKQGD